MTLAIRFLLLAALSNINGLALQIIARERGRRASVDRNVFFDLRLTQKRKNLKATVRALVNNCDTRAYRTQKGFQRLSELGRKLCRGTSSFGYWDINLEKLEGKRIIYPLHAVMAATGSELRVALFVVQSVVNDRLAAAACKKCGMRNGPAFGDYQGACDKVRSCSLKRAQECGWY